MCVRSERPHSRTYRANLVKYIYPPVTPSLQYNSTYMSADSGSLFAQNVATNEECLKQANSLIMILKADVRALNSCAVRLLAPSEAGRDSETSAPSEVARRYDSMRR